MPKEQKPPQAQPDAIGQAADPLALLRNKIDLVTIPFTERGSRILLFADPAEQALHIKLAERWIRREEQFGNYRVRAPIVSRLQFLNAQDEPLPLTWTTYPDRVELDTGAGQAIITFQDQETLHLQLPPGTLRLAMNLHLLEETARTDRRGGEVREGRGGRNIAYTTNARIVGNDLTRLEADRWRLRLTLEAGAGAALTLNVTPRLGFNRALPVAGAAAAAARRQWQRWFSLTPAVPERYWVQYYYAWWIMAAGIISPRFYMTRAGMTPSKVHYVGVWQWDAYFHALAYRHVDMGLAEDQIRIFLDHQLPNGMIPDAVHDEGLVTRLPMPVAAPVTKPPLAAWAALKLHEISGNTAFLDEIYDNIVRWNRWWLAENDSDGDGVIEYTHPYSSGLDDSPLWDLGMPVESPDLNTYLYIQMESLAKMARLLGMSREAAGWTRRARQLLARLVRHSYDAQAGLFWAQKQHRRVPVLTPFNLYPLWSGRLAPAINERLLAHLTNPAELWRPFPLPSVAHSDPAFDALTMWRGPVWLNINYIFVEALQRVGRRDLARALADRSIDLVMGQNDIAEYYDPETGAIPPKAAPMQGWTAAVFIDLLIRRSRGLI